MKAYFQQLQQKYQISSELMEEIVSAYEATMPIWQGINEVTYTAQLKVL